MKLTVWQFVHHFPTHSTVWEIHETDYETMGQVPEIVIDRFFPGQRDGMVYSGWWPHMSSREQAMAYVRLDDDAYTHYEVIEIN